MAITRVTEISAGSKKSFEDAVEKGIARASKTLKNLSGAWGQEMKNSTAAAAFRGRAITPTG